MQLRGQGREDEVGMGLTRWPFVNCHRKTSADSEVKEAGVIEKWMEGEKWRPWEQIFEKFCVKGIRDGVLTIEDLELKEKVYILKSIFPRI